MNRHTLTRARRGFSLTEVLVALCIVAILAALLFPAIRKVMVSARRTSCVSNLSQLSSAFVMYRSEHDQYLPGAGPSAAANERWMQKVAPYLGIPESTMANNIAYYEPIFHCPMVPSWVYAPKASTAGYGVYGAPRTIVLLGKDLGMHYLQIKDPERKVLLADKSSLGYAGSGGAGPGLDITAPFPRHPDGAAANHRPDGLPTSGPDGACNYLFVDGHVETLMEWPGADAFNPSK